MCRRPTRSSHPREGSHLRQRTASSRHANGGGPRPETGPHHNSPSHRNLPRHTPCQPQCHHRPGARPRLPCPVPACSGQPLPGKRSFSFPLLHRISVLSSANGPSTAALQQRCHRTSASARSPSWPPMPGPHLQRAATVRPERIQLPIVEQNFLIKDIIM
jgi:hypothetical protein